ncbi:oligomeric, coiled-coil, peripheral membrane protein [Batrachochytrium dendrobatidis]|nr:oligomeric, coiled-coil, peripheral membrane protein [Batrachochytrium dendrobatidis]
MSLKVYQAETGILLPLQRLVPGDTVDMLRADIEAVTFIPQKFQVLLGSNAQIVKQSMLTTLLSSQKDERIFIFNRLALMQQTGNKPVHMSIDIEPPVPSDTVVGLKVISPLAPNLSSKERVIAFKRAFSEHISYGQALRKIANKHAKTCERLLEEQSIQVEGLTMALCNLFTHRKSVLDSYDSFIAPAQIQISSHTELLHGIAADLDTLTMIPIHEAIVSESKVLNDYIPRDKLLRWINDCRVAHDELVDKVQSISVTMNDVRAGARIDQLEPEDFDLSKLDPLLDIVRKLVGQIESRQNILERDFTRVETILADISNGPDDQAGDRFEALEHLYKIHFEEYIPEITRCDRQVRETVVQFSDSKAHLTQALMEKLLELAKQQSTIYIIPQALMALDKELRVQAEAFLQLLHVHRMPPAWGAAFIEIVRRREHSKVLGDKVNQIMGILTSFQNQEEARRDTFRTEIERYLPKGLLKGLESATPSIKLSISEDEILLPNLTKDDVTAFSQMVASLRAIQDPSTVQTSGSLSKLHAMMVQMSPQVDSPLLDFEELISNSTFCDRIVKLEAENAKLRKEVVEMRAQAAPVSQTSTAFRHPSMNDVLSSSHSTKQEEKIKAYEARIKNLEQLLQQSYSTSGAVEKTHVTDRRLMQEMESTIQTMSLEKERILKENQQFCDQLQQSAQRISELTTLYQNVRESHDKLRNEKQTTDVQLSNTLVELKKLQDFLVEVREYMEGCCLSLRRDTGSEQKSDIEEQTPVQLNHIRSKPASIDELRRCMRVLKDDILWHAAMMESMKNSMQDSQDGSDVTQSVAAEMVTLIQRLGETEERLRIAENDLTVAQAHEAVLEADLESLKVLYERAEGHVAAAKVQRNEHQAQQEKNALELKRLQDLQESQIEQHRTSEVVLQKQIEQIKKELEQTQADSMADIESQKQAHTKAIEQMRLDMQQDLSQRELSRLAFSQVQQMREQIEDWNIVCRLSLQHLTGCLDALVRLVQHTLSEDVVYALIRNNGLTGSTENCCLSKLSDTFSISDAGAHYDDTKSLIEGFGNDDDALGGMSKFIEHYDLLLRELYSKVVSAGAYLDVSDSVDRIEKRWSDLTGQASFRVAFQNFKINDLVLFLPTRNPAAWTAFNVNTPHFFLDIQPNSVFADRIQQRGWILAYITGITDKTATDISLSPTNPFGLAEETRYHICQATPY